MELDSSRPSSYFLFHLRWRSRVQLLVVRGPPAYAYVDPCPSRPSLYFLFHLRWRSRVQLLVVRGPPAYAYEDPLSFQPIGVHGPPPQLKIVVGWKRVTFFYQFLPSFFLWCCFVFFFGIFLDNSMEPSDGWNFCGVSSTITYSTNFLNSILVSLLDV